MSAADGPSARLAPGEFVQSLDRGIAVIRSFGAQRPRQSLSDVARATGLSPAAARRFLLTLQAMGYVRSDGRTFELCPKVLEIGYSYLASLSWWRHAQGVAERVAARVGQPCAVGVLDGVDVVYVAYAASTRFELFGRAAGTRLPAHATAIGRVLLAGLPEDELGHYFARSERPPLTPLTVTDEAPLRRVLAEVAAKGWCQVDQEFEIGLGSIGVPILDRGRRLVAGLSVSFRAGSMTDAHRSELLEGLRTAAQDVEQALAI